jgi:hypothetical protein
MNTIGKRIPQSDHDQIYPKNPGEYLLETRYGQLDPPLAGYSRVPLQEIRYKGPKERIFWFIPPIQNGKLEKIKEGRWFFREEPNGVLTVTPIIAVREEWCGLLIKGKWHTI